jgi:hypothetical protein
MISPEPPAPISVGHGPAHEADTTSVRGVAVFAAGLVIGVVIVQLSVWGMWSHLQAARPGWRPNAPPPPSIEAQFAPSRHWTNPSLTLEELRERENARLSVYQWIDQPRGVVRIPIDRAMELLASRRSLTGSRSRATTTP